MSWYLVAVVMFAGSIVPDFKINTAVKFHNETSCTEYVNLYEDQLRGGLHRAFSTIESSLIASNVRPMLAKEPRILYKTPCGSCVSS